MSLLNVILVIEIVGSKYEHDTIVDVETMKFLENIDFYLFSCFFRIIKNHFFIAKSDRLCRNNFKYLSESQQI